MRVDYWKGRKAHWKEQYTFTNPIPIRSNFNLDQGMLQECAKAGNNCFVPFSALIPNIDEVKGNIKRMLGAHHRMDDDLDDMPFFLDSVQIRNICTVSPGKFLCNVGVSVGLPYLKHTNTSPYRWVDPLGGRYRAINLNNPHVNYHNGSPQQSTVPVDNETFAGKWHDILTPEHKLQYEVSFPANDPHIEEQSIESIRGSMMHLYDILDEKKCYPSHHPRKSQVYNGAEGMINKVHIKNDAYTSTWFAKDVSPDVLQVVGACVDEQKYASTVHRFMNKYVKARMCNFNNAGLYLSFDQFKVPHYLSGDIVLTACFIIKKPIVGEYDMTTHSAIKASTAEMVESTDS